MATNFPILIALSGRAGSGKSAITEVLTGDDFGFVRLKFAQGLKDMTRSLLSAAGCPEDEIEAHVEGYLKETPCNYLAGHSPRKVQITLGTDWGRETLGSDFWVKITRHRVTSLMNAGFSVVIDDLRFPNEAHMVRSMGGVTFRLHRDSHVSIDHVSEKLDFDCDYVIDNNGTIRNSMRQITEALNI